MCNDGCGGDCNVPDDEVMLYFEKQLLPFNLGDLKFRRVWDAGPVLLRFEAYRGDEWVMLFTLWLRGKIAGFHASSVECLKSDAKLRETLLDRLDATEEEISAVAMVWKEEIQPIVAAFFGDPGRS